MKWICFLLVFTSYARAVSPEKIWQKAQAHYEAAEWEKFFGLVTFTRVRFPKEKLTERLRLLEALAYLRHCQLSLARAAVNEALPLAHELRDDFLSLKTLLQDEATSVADRMDSKESPERTNYLFGRNLWRLRTSDLETLSPWSMRKSVASLCEVPR